MKSPAVGFEFVTDAMTVVGTPWYTVKLTESEIL